MLFYSLTTTISKRIISKQEDRVVGNTGNKIIFTAYKKNMEKLCLCERDREEEKMSVESDSIYLFVSIIHGRYYSCSFVIMQICFLNIDSNDIYKKKT
jgi:hypothetical protein